jgi:ankyrin repeat protein
MIAMDVEGRTDLHYAALANDVAAVGERLAAGDDPDASDRQGFTPLHLAAQEGALNAAEILLDHGAAVDQPNAFGNTPLFVAVSTVVETGRSSSCSGSTMPTRCGPTAAVRRLPG